mgnify:FL=1
MKKVKSNKMVKKVSRIEITETANVLEFMKMVPSGYMIFYGAAVKGEEFQTTIFIKTGEKLIKRLGYSPTIQILAGLLNVDEVKVLNMQLRINVSDKLHFEGYLNYMTEYELPAFKDFSSLDTINLV